MTQKSPFKNGDSLSELGEFGLIDQIAQLFGRKGGEGETGIGDDCAVIPYKGDRSLLVTTDMLIEDRHFRRHWISAEDLGYKSLAVNLSDISAMGGKPLHAFLSIGLPEDLSLEWIEKFFRGTHALSSEHNIKLMGGDTTKSPGPMVINYTILGEIKTENVLWRSAAKLGDKVAVLGNLGESGAGLKLLLEQKPPFSSSEQKLMDAHHRPRLFVDEAQFLAEAGGVHAMIDLSDGLLSDGGHIAKASGVSLEVESEKITITQPLQNVCEKNSWNPLELALASGEDYGLLFTIDGEKAETLKRDFKTIFGYGFSIIGEVKDGPAELKLMKNGKTLDLGKTGFDHFKSG